MKFLASNFRPLDTDHQTYYETWADLFHRNNRIQIAVGYASNDSLLYLRKLIELNSPKEVNICLGMAKFEGLFSSQVSAAKELSNYLSSNNIGEVYLSQQFPFHGKIQTFASGTRLTAGVVGSSNLSNIVPTSGVTRSYYEFDVLVDEPARLRELDTFLKLLFKDAVVTLPESLGNLKIRSDPNLLMNSTFGVEEVDQATKNRIWNSATGSTFEIPIKTTEKSNLNTFFGKGRENAQGFVAPRHWYETEIIVGRRVQESAVDYPIKKDFITYTDDGYKFILKTSGDYGKNLRSRDDLTLLGRWLKGRMESAHCLESGQPVTAKVLYNYGRDTIVLTKTNNLERDPVSGEMLEVWAIDFARPNS